MTAPASLIVISGPNGSGKSRFAEELACRVSARRYYIATMVPRTAENWSRIEAHQTRRVGLGFQTLELPGPVGAAPVTPASTVLLEDISNFWANMMFDIGWTVEQAFHDLETLRNRCGRLIAVTIQGLSASDYSGETADYIRGLNQLNQLLLRVADSAVQMCAGVPHVVKGQLAVVETSIRPL